MEKKAPIDAVQAETIIAALMSLNAGVLDDVELEIIKLIELDDSFTTGIVCQFNATIPDDPNGRGQFSLWIGYWDKNHKKNPETIALVQDKAIGYTPLPIGNLGYVTDKLREYKVW